MKLPENLEPKKIIDVSREDQYRTAGELIDKARADESFYWMLILSSIIIAGGVLVNNIPIIIGGMLVTPLLTPILVIALGLATGELNLMQRTLILLAKSIGAVVGGSLILGLIFGGDVIFPLVADSMSATFLYFVIAVASGIAVTFAWIRKEANEVLPGIAIVVSLVPPLSYLGVALAKGEFKIALTFAIIFTLNIIGIVLGSLVVFSLSRFNHDRLNKAVERKAQQIEADEEKKKKEKEQQRAEEAAVSQPPAVEEPAPAAEGPDTEEEQAIEDAL